MENTSDEKICFVCKIILKKPNSWYSVDFTYSGTYYYHYCLKCRNEIENELFEKQINENYDDFLLNGINGIAL